jgi:hypothetical protein
MGRLSARARALAASAGAVILAAGYAALAASLFAGTPASCCLFNTTARAGGVLGTAAFDTAYLALVHHPSQAGHGFAVVSLTLAVTALAAAGMAALSVRRREPRPRSQ